MGTDFIRDIINQDKESRRFAGRVHTRFPPEPNGYLHVGHAKAICIDFGIAEEYGGLCNLRFDDSNPVAEKQEYIDAIKTDIKWLGFDWEDREFYASDYFDQLYDWAIKLISSNQAYVDDLSADRIREYRGTLTEPGRESPYRDRSAEENLTLFEDMRKGKFSDGTRVLRARIDMSHPNMNMRDPVMYRILHTRHHRQGDKWPIYPTYDWVHGQSDSIEGITHSLCSLEFEDHRLLYDWFLDQLGIHHPRQIEFARLNLSYVITSTRKLKKLVEAGYVNGWDDPRLPTLAGLRRRGYSPEAVRRFVQDIGIAKTESVIDIAKLEHYLREDLNRRSRRFMAVLKPVKLVIDNYPDNQIEELEAVNNPEDPAAGTRKVPFSRVLYIEQDDFREEPPPKYYRLAPGREVRLRYAYFVKCTNIEKDDQGNVREIHCLYDPATRGGDAPDGRKVKATIHWVSAEQAINAEVRLYDRLFTRPDPEDASGDKSFVDSVNPRCLEIIPAAKVEPCLAESRIGEILQFERLGYFVLDQDSEPGNLIFNRAVTLRDTWAKIERTL